VRAEVPRADDPRTQTNRELIDRSRPGHRLLFVAGEAASHCVCATLTHLFEEMTAEERTRVVLVRDCMSPVAGFEAHASEFFERARAQGAQVMTSRDALQLL